MRTVDLIEAFEELYDGCPLNAESKQAVGGMHEEQAVQLINHLKMWGPVIHKGRVYTTDGEWIFRMKYVRTAHEVDQVVRGRTAGESLRYGIPTDGNGLCLWLVEQESTAGFGSNLCAHIIAWAKTKGIHAPVERWSSGMVVEAHQEAIRFLEDRLDSRSVYVV